MSVESEIIESIMVRPVKTGREGQTIKDIAKVMNQANIGSVVILKSEGEALAGILTERDIVRVAAGDRPLNFFTPVREVMSAPVITITSTSTLKDAIQTMQLKNIRRLPVVNRDNKMIGIITDKDIFRAIMGSESMAASFCESLSVEYRPVYERFSEFMMEEFPFPERSAQRTAV
jgi:CBS domain-containing protein